MSGHENFFIAQKFLSLEAKLLDERRFDEWFSLLDDEIVYNVPIREARLAYADEHSEGAYRIRDDKGLIGIRIERLKSGHAWAETPPSRTLRVVGSLIVEPLPDDRLSVESAMILYRQRGHDSLGDIIPVRRQDELRLTSGGPKLLKRTALISEVVLSTPNLGVFL
jgi:3-phenylpropionate/cinnamic acid dioxygenase small subunit